MLCSLELVVVMAMTLVFMCVFSFETWKLIQVTIMYPRQAVPGGDEMVI